MNPAAFSLKLVKCVQEDWQLDDAQLLRAFPSLAEVTGNEVWKHYELKDPQTALQTTLDAYLKLVKDAKQKRKGDPCL